MNFESLNAGLPQSTLNEHHISGYLYSKEQYPAGASDWKAQYLCNTLVRKELADLGQLFRQKKIAPCLLKGYSLMGDIYADCGSRFASDVDILIPTEDIERTLLLLQFCGYKAIPTKTWRGDNFKYLLTKTKNKIDITIEIHTRLFWHTKTDWQNHLTTSDTVGFYKLRPELQLIHLCGHLGFQHTFLKLFWFVDIYEYVKKYQTSIKWSNFWDMAYQYQLFKSCYLCLYLCHNLGFVDINFVRKKAPKKYRISLFFLKKLLTSSFLFNPRKHFIRYFLIKNLIKDRLSDSLIYSLLWLASKGFTKKSN